MEEVEEDTFKKWSASSQALLSTFETDEFLEERKMSEELNQKDLEIEFSEQQLMMAKVTTKKKEERLEEKISLKLQGRRREEKKLLQRRQRR